MATLDINKPGNSALEETKTLIFFICVPLKGGLQKDLWTGDPRVEPTRKSRPTSLVRRSGLLLPDTFVHALCHFSQR
ncbi:MAG: hypothetical protein P4L82_03565 [Ancalomicrobiaceae bacterium]|nr:hypothetical protein [Ancalomicrobiaceae bacterium]